MKEKIILLTIMIPVFWSSTSLSKIKTIEPIIASKPEIVLGKEIKNLLKKWNKDFKPFRFDEYMEPARSLFNRSKTELPMGVILDFNNDKINDLILMGHDLKKTYILAILSDANGFYQIKRVKTYVYKESEKILNHIDGTLYKGRNRYLSLLMEGKITSGFQIEVYRSQRTKAYRSLK